MSKKTKHVLVLITVNVFFILVCFFVLVPVLYAFSVSLNAENSLLGSDFSFLPNHMTLQNYKAVFTEKPVLLWLKNSLDPGGDHTGDLTGDRNPCGICFFPETISRQKGDFEDVDFTLCISVPFVHDGPV